jgi:hypothetical protein
VAELARAVYSWQAVIITRTDAVFLEPVGAQILLLQFDDFESGDLGFPECESASVFLFNQFSGRYDISDISTMRFRWMPRRLPSKVENIEDQVDRFVHSVFEDIARQSAFGPFVEPWLCDWSPILCHFVLAHQPDIGQVG